MSFSKQIKQTLRQGLSRLYRDRPALIGFLFHGIFLDQNEIDKARVDAQQGVTLAHMQQFIEHFLQAGYEFITPEKNLDALDRERKYVCITFDDGYFNNLRILPLLQQYNIPATFYVTTGNIENQHCFWWDVVYRQRKRLGTDKPTISKEQKMLKQKNHAEILDYLRQEFGQQCLEPWSDTDRPMTIDELQSFENHSGVYIGNHTRDHYLLDQYSDTEVEKQILDAQQDLEKWLGSPPSSIAYPNGNYSEAAMKAAQKAGLHYGFSLDKQKNHLPIKSTDLTRFHLGRYTLWGRNDIGAQCEVIRSDIPL